MDAHFSEYLGAIAGMNDLYGERTDDHPTEFHADCTEADAAVTPAGHGVAVGLAASL